MKGQLGGPGRSQGFRVWGLGFRYGMVLSDYVYLEPHSCFVTNAWREAQVLVAGRALGISA